MDFHFAVKHQLVRICNLVDALEAVRGLFGGQDEKHLSIQLIHLVIHSILHKSSLQLLLLLARRD
jgi:hypothetical protein